MSIVQTMSLSRRLVRPSSVRRSACTLAVVAVFGAVCGCSSEVGSESSSPSPTTEVSVADGAPSAECLEAAESLYPTALDASNLYLTGAPLKASLAVDLDVGITWVVSSCSDLGSAGGSAYYQMRNSAGTVAECLTNANVVAAGFDLGDCGLSIVTLENGLKRVLADNP